MANDAERDVNELSLSTLSIHSQEDWDKSSSDIQLENKSSSRPATPKAENVANGTRRLAALLQKHAEDGKAVELSPEDEAKLGEELADWINSDSSPFEPDEDWFQRKADEITVQKGSGEATKT